MRRSLLLYILAAFTLLSGCKGGNAVPEPGSEQYAEAVTAFYTGLAAMQAGEGLGAEDQLERVTTIAPGEPAAWANLAVISMRRGDYEEAAERLERALAGAPDNAEIELLAGRLASGQGNADQAIAHFQRATELDPRNARAKYALLEEAERAGNTGIDAERLLNEILQIHPGNLAALVELARVQARKGNNAGVQATIAKITEKSEEWPAEIRDQLGKASGAGATQVAFLRNMLMRLPQFRHDQAIIKMPAEEGAELIEQLIRMPDPDARPSPADSTTTFTAAPLPNMPAGAWNWARPIVLLVDQPAQIVRSDGRSVEIRQGLTLPFPGNGTAPGPNGITAIDFNYDYRADLAFAGPAGSRLYRQEPDGSFVDITAAAGLPSGSFFGVWTADLDMEGDMDLVLAPTSGAPRVLQNNGNGTFTPVRMLEQATDLRAFAWADLDADGDPDGAALSASGDLRFFVNGRGGHFEVQSAPVKGVAAITVTDLNGDALLDVLSLADNGALSRLSWDATAQSWKAYPVTTWQNKPASTPGATALLAVDLDNNGGIDLVASTPDRAQIWFARPDGSWRPQATVAGLVLGTADLSGDGRLDLVGTSQGQPRWFANQGSFDYGWKVFRPRAATVLGDQRINSFGIGGEIELRSGLLFQKQPITEPLVHFGLGEKRQAEVARIVWPNGNVQAEFALQANEPLVTSQRLKGSCPWLFAWNGKEMEFITDVIWRSPLGLRINATTTAGANTTLDWVKVRGDQLTARNGIYDLRITAELWETHYFDHVSLLVVDHPDSTEVFVDERFAFPPPKMDVHAMSTLRPIARALDHKGADVTRVVRRLDEDYLGGFDVTPYHGITKDHWVEIDLGDDVPADGTLWLVGQGWLRPTDSSLNVAISQGTTAPPNGITIEIPDGKGGWTPARKDLGFPAGKTKTVLLDLTGLFKPGMPKRLRLRTTSEIYWDALSWTVPLPKNTMRTRHLMPVKADLRYRGYSKTYEANRRSPELPIYAELNGTGQYWRDLTGYYTRFGDVMELMEKVDDRYAILNAGDELVFHFREPAPPPKGWKRDFVFISDGWEKDGDYHTTFGQTVIPLPTHAKADYTTPVLRLEDDPVYQQHREDWVRYHTRYVGTERFQSALVPRK